jgi:hypothetical protein
MYTLLWSLPYYVDGRKSRYNVQCVDTIYILLTQIKYQEPDPDILTVVMTRLIADVKAYIARTVFKYFHQYSLFPFSLHEVFLLDYHILSRPFIIA